MTGENIDVDWRIRGVRVVRADEAYIRDSILQPRRDIVGGYESIMPSFSGLLDEGELQRIVAYIRSLRPEEAQ